MYVYMYVCLLNLYYCVYDRLHIHTLYIIYILHMYMHVCIYMCVFACVWLCVCEYPCACAYTCVQVHLNNINCILTYMGVYARVLMENTITPSHTPTEKLSIFMTWHHTASSTLLLPLAKYTYTILKCITSYCTNNIQILCLGGLYWIYMYMQLYNHNLQITFDLWCLLK